MTTFPLHYRLRDGLATLPSMLVLAALIVAGVRTVTEYVPHADNSEVKISLVTSEPVVAPPVVQPEPPKPQVVPKQVKPIAMPKPAPVTPAPAPVATVSPAPAPVAEVAAVASPAQPVQEAAVSSPPVTPSPASASAPKANLEQLYTAQLRAHINNIKRYPTGREASQQRPQGIVKVWFVLRRNGSVVDVGIEKSSNSMILDNAARTTINRTNFTAFPSDAWLGQDTHRFTADLEYIPA